MTQDADRGHQKQASDDRRRRELQSCAVQLDRYARLGEEHMTERAPLDSTAVLDTLSRLDVDHEYELYKFARRLMHRVPNFRAVSATALMHIQEERTDGKTMMAFWEPLAGGQPDGPQKWLVGQLSEKVGPEEFQRLVTTHGTHGGTA